MLSINKSEYYTLWDELKSRMTRIKSTIVKREFDILTPNRCDIENNEYEYDVFSYIMLLIIKIIRKTYKLLK